jgi:hypothetical protein
MSDAMIRHLRTLFAACALLAGACASAPSASAQAQSHWDNVVRVVAIGDLEGDYEKFADMLRTANVIDPQGNWIGGRAHLVQLGDIPDRGPNSRMIMDHLMRLEPQARRAGGYVHALIGNHEAMNVEGDLRYVHPGEYAAFADAGSERRRQRFYQATVEALRAQPPATGLPVFDDAFRAQWESTHPLGYVEHREAWGPSGRYGRWIASHDAVIRINDTLFVHGGLGPSFVLPSADAMNDAVSAALRGRPDPTYPDIVTNQEGPLWYRGLSLNAEETERANLEALLARHGVARIVVGHTKRASTVWPRFNGRVLIADIAVPAGFSDPHAYLEIDDGSLTTIYRQTRVPLRAATQDETCAYLAAIAALDSAGSPNSAAAAQCAAPAAVEAIPGNVE